MTKEEIVKKLHERNFPISRMISGSKTGYSNTYPNSVPIFNSNIITPEHGKVWFGDLDITKDGEKLKKIAEECKTIFYILRESDARFGKEDRPVSTLVEHSVWNTTQKVITMQEYRERNR